MSEKEPLAAHNASIEGDKQQQEELRARLQTYPSIRYEDLEWLDAGLEGKTDSELIEWIRARMLKNEMGVLTPPIDAVRMKGLTALLNKLQPDLKAVEHTGEVVQRHAKELSDAELASIAAGGGTGAADTPPSPPKPAPVH